MVGNQAVEYRKKKEQAAPEVYTENRVTFFFQPAPPRPSTQLSCFQNRNLSVGIVLSCFRLSLIIFPIHLPILQRGYLFCLLFLSFLFLLPGPCLLLLYPCFLVFPLLSNFYSAPLVFFFSPTPERRFLCLWVIFLQIRILLRKVGIWYCSSKIALRRVILIFQEFNLLQFFSMLFDSFLVIFSMHFPKIGITIIFFSCSTILLGKIFFCFFFIFRRKYAVAVLSREVLPSFKQVRRM